MTKQFGVADLYQATRLAETSVLITAVGEAPNLNTLMSQVKHCAHGLSTPCLAARRLAD
jgi:hypothetical protein